MLINMAAFPQRKIAEAIEWKKIATLTNTDGTPSLGFAGAINAIAGNSMLIAGGANFPRLMPWEGGKKKYSDEIHVLQRRNGKYVWNKNIYARLPHPIAYCGNTSTPLGIVYAGGENDAGISDKAFLLKLDPDRDEISFTVLPSLPLPLTNISLTNIGTVVYAAGGDGPLMSSSRFFSLDLASGAEKWTILPDMPAALANALVVAQQAAGGMKIYVAGGRSKTPSGISELRSGLFIYDPIDRTWKTGASISDGNRTMNFSAGTGVAVSDRFLILSGGDDGDVFHQIETYLAQIAKASSEKEKAKLTIAKNKLITQHKGFYPGVLVYDTFKDSWRKAGELPFLPRVTTTADLWGKQIVLSSGEIRPGVRTPDIMLGRIRLNRL